MANKKDLRGSIEKMREVAQLLSEWASDMERSLAKGSRKNAVDETAPPAAAPVASAAVDAAPAAASAVPVGDVVAPVAPPSAAEVRALLAEKCAAGFRTQVQAAINAFGAAKFSEVPAEHYPALLEMVGELGGEGHAG